MLTAHDKLDNLAKRYGQGSYWAVPYSRIESRWVRAYRAKRLWWDAYADMEKMDFGKVDGLTDDSPAYVAAEGDYHRNRTEWARLIRDLWLSRKLERMNRAARAA